jgi:predicted transcriptional regulator of viral defense system
MRHLVGKEGRNIFSCQQAQDAAKTLHIQPSYVAEILHYLQKEDWIRRLKRGLYAVRSDSGFGTTPHDYEIAMALVSPSAISYWTAMRYHHITQQIPHTICALVPTGTSIPRTLSKHDYHYIQVKPDHYFGFEQIWVEQSQVSPVLVTDLERTLLDGLTAPQYCGDFQEVLHAFIMAMAQQGFNLEKLIDYALRLDGAVGKRLGWVLEKLEFENAKLAKLFAIPIKGYRKLDSSRPSRGPYNRKWMIRENL